MSTTMTATEARADLYRLIDQTAESHQPIRIVGKRTSAVLISAAAHCRQTQKSPNRSLGPFCILERETRLAVGH